jgi:PAS domain S-box-containing protein
VQRIFELSLDLTCVIDFDGRYAAVNPAFERTLGYPPEQMLGRAFIDFVHPDDREASAGRFSDVLAGDEVAHFESRYVAQDGSERWLEWSARGVPEERVVYATARDVSERRRFHAEQAALRRVATLVARQAAQTEILKAIAEECARLLGTPAIEMLRYDGDSMVVVASTGRFRAGFPVGSRHPLGGQNVSTLILRTGRAVRIDGYGPAGGSIGEAAIAMGLRSALGAPIIVDGQIWGALIIGVTAELPLPRETEERLGEFTDLMATAIANTQSRARAARLAEEQAALRAVATLVARGTPSEEVFAAVTEEIGRILPVDYVYLGRYEADRTIRFLNAWGRNGPNLLAGGQRTPLGGNNLSTRVFETEDSCRIDDYAIASGPVGDTAREGAVRSGVGTPVVVDGRLWGLMAVAWSSDDPPPRIEARLASFTELLATAIANTESRARAERLADEQGALRQVATLVAGEASMREVFGAVTEEAMRVLGATVGLLRFEEDATATLVAQSDPPWPPPPLGTSFRLDGENLVTSLYRTGHAARQDEWTSATGEVSAMADTLGVRSSVATPIVVDGRLWGTMIVTGNEPERLAPDTEARLGRFANLVALAIANAEAREAIERLAEAQAASRTRLLKAADDARRRVVHDLHDGAQQRLVHSIVTLKLAQRTLRETDGEARSLVDEALEQVKQGNVELRELAQGILPSVLTHDGLQAGVESVVSRLGLPVHADVPNDRFPAEIEASAYFIIAEALTNVVKHAHATRAEVRARVESETLLVEVRDDGVGGADPGGHGLVGLSDRATALGGRFQVERLASGGTLVAAELPLPAVPRL